MLKKLLLVFLLSSCCFSLFSSNQIIWTWNETDEKVAWYRYQINDDSSNSWIYIPNIPQKRYIIIDVDSSVTEYVLYIQSSYDGINWSDSAKSIVSTDSYNTI